MAEIKHKARCRKMFHVYMLFDHNGKETKREFITKDKKVQEMLGRSLLEYGIPLEYVSSDGEHTFDFYNEDTKGVYKSLIIGLVDMSQGASSAPVSNLPIATAPQEVIVCEQIDKMEKSGILTKVS